MANDFWKNLTRYFNGGVQVGNSTIKATMNPVTALSNLQKVAKESERISAPKTKLDSIVDNYEAKLKQAKGGQWAERKQAAANTTKTYDPISSMIKTFGMVKDLTSAPTSYDSQVNDLTQKSKEARVRQAEQRKRITLDGFDKGTPTQFNPVGHKENIIAGKSTGDVTDVLYGTGDYGLLRYNFMTPDERNTYFYTKQTQGQGVANKYLDALDSDLKSRMGNAVAEKGKDNPFASTLISLDSGAKDYASGVGETIRRGIGFEEPLDPSVSQRTYETMSPQLTGAQKVLSDVGYTVGNVLPSVAVGLATGGAGAAPALANLAGSGAMALGLFGQTYSNERRQGASDDEALAYSAVNTALETGLQYVLGGIKGVSAGTLSKVFGNTFKNVSKKLATTPAFVQFITKTMAQGGSEALEEWIQAAVDPVVRNITLNENNEFNPLSEEALYSAFLGFATAGFMNAPSNIGEVRANTPVATSHPIVQPIETKQESQPIASEKIQAQETVPQKPVLQEATNKPPRVINKENDNLIQEAKKYKSAEDFINAIVRKHYTTSQSAIALRKGSAFDYSRSPVHGTGSKSLSDKKQGRIVDDGGFALYLSLDDNKWNKVTSTRSYNPTEVVDLSGMGIDEITNFEKQGGVIGYNYDTQRYEGIPNGKIVQQLEGVDYIIEPNSKKLVIDSIGSYRNAINEMGATPDDASFWAAARRKYDIVEIKNVDSGKKIPETVDKAAKRFFQQVKGDQIIVLNKNKAKISDDNFLKDIYNQSISAPQDIVSPETPNTTDSVLTPPQPRQDTQDTSGMIAPSLVENAVNTPVGVENNIETIGRAPNKLRGIYQAFVSTQEPLENINKVQSRGSNTESLVDGKTQLVRQAGGTADYIITKENVDRYGNTIGEPLMDAIKPIKNNLDIINKYALDLHNIDRQAQGKPVNRNTAEESARIVSEIEQSNPTIRQDLKRVQEVWNTFVDNWFVGGFLSQDQLNLFRTMYPNYVPTPRLGKGGSSGSGENVVKKATGSTKQVAEIQNSYIQYINRAVKAVRMNDLNLELLNFARSNPQEAANAGITLSEYVAPENTGDPYDAFIESPYESNNGKYNVTVYENGQPVTMNLSKDMYNALDKMRKRYDSDEIASAVNVLKKASGVFKITYTGINAVFTATNVIRDFQTYMIQGSNSNPLSAISYLGKSFAQLAKNGEYAKKYKALGGYRGGGFISQIKYNSTGDIVELPQTFIDKSIGGKLASILSAPFRGIANVGQFTENVPRLAEMMYTMDKRGKTNESGVLGAQAAADVTTNFSRFGGLGDIINSFTLYFNATLQGLDKVARQFKSHPVKTSLSSVAWSILPSVLLAFMNHGNSNYDDLDDRTKDAYFLIPNLADIDENGQAKTFIKIPRARVYGEIMGALTDRLFYAIEKGDLGESFKGFGKTFWNAIAVPSVIEDNIASPFLSLSSNKDFAGRNIVPESMKNIEPKYQYDISTSGAAVGLGNALNVSPKQVDYLLTQLGYPGKLIQGATSQQVNTAGEAAQKALTEPFTRAFTADPRYSSKAVDDLYKSRDEAQTKVSTENYLGAATDESKQNLKGLTSATDIISDLKKYEKQILGSDLSTEEKKAITDNLREQTNDLARISSGNGESLNTQPVQLYGYTPAVDSDGNLSNTALNAMNLGISAVDYYKNNSEIMNTKPVKDASGETVDYSLDYNRKQSIDALSLSDEQKQSMYEMYDISPKVINGQVNEVTINNALYLSNLKSGLPVDSNLSITSTGETVDYSKIPTANLIPGAESVTIDPTKLTNETLSKVANIGMSLQDYFFIKDRVDAFSKKDQPEYLASLGLDGEELINAVEAFVMTAKDKAKMQLAIDGGANKNEYIMAYLSGTLGGSGGGGSGTSQKKISLPAIKAFTLPTPKEYRKIPTLSVATPKSASKAAYEQELAVIQGAPWYTAKQKAGMIKSLKERYNQ